VPGGFFSVRGAFVRFFFVELGVGYANAEDKAPFQEEACNKWTGECATRSSAVHGFLLSAETGVLGRLFVPLGHQAIALTGLAGIGHHGVHLKQHSGFENCDGCSSGGSVPVDGGFYVSPQAELAYTIGNDPTGGLLLGARGKYDHHLTGDLTHAVWFGAVMEYVMR
jgi:hypothetical protein